MRELLLDPPGAVGNAVDLLFDETRTMRMLIAMNQAHEVSFSGGRAVGGDMKLDGVAGLHRYLVCVTEYLDLRHGAKFPIEKVNAAPARPARGALGFEKVADAAQEQAMQAIVRRCVDRLVNDKRRACPDAPTTGPPDIFGTARPS